MRAERSTMSEALRIAATGLRMEDRRLAVAAHNVANVSTPGFQARRLDSQPVGSGVGGGGGDGGGRSG